MDLVAAGLDELRAVQQAWKRPPGGAKLLGTGGCRTQRPRVDGSTTRRVRPEARGNAEVRSVDAEWKRGRIHHEDTEDAKGKENSGVLSGTVTRGGVVPPISNTRHSGQGDHNENRAGEEQVVRDTVCRMQHL